MGLRVAGGSDVMSLSAPLLALLLLVYATGLGSSTTTYVYKCPAFPPSTEVTYQICDADNQTSQTSQFSDDTECSYTTSRIPFERCNSSASPTSLACWKVLDDKGTVEVSFPFLPQRCHYTQYEGRLKVYETSDRTCSNFSQDKIHSSKEIKIEDCSKSPCSGPCSKRGKMIFRHVFSGCYQLALIPYRYLQPYSKESLLTHFSYLDTGHTKTPIPPDLTLKHDVTPNGLSLKAIFRTNPTSSRFKLMQDVDISLDQEACRKTGTCIATCDTFSELQSISCDFDRSKTNVSCYYQNANFISCDFMKVRAGNYCVRVQFHDDRCLDSNTEWEEENSTIPRCSWQTGLIEVKREEPPGNEKVTGDLDFKIFIMIPLLVFIVLVILGTTCWRHHREDHYNKFFPVMTLPTQVPDRPRVLLLYARDCPAFLEVVAQLRKVLKRACDCEVMDCWDESQYESVAQGPIHWFSTVLSDPKVRTVLVTSPASILFHSCMVKGAKVRYQQPKAFDGVLSYALNALHENYSHNSYKSLFIVRLDSRGDGIPHQPGTFLNSLTSYELPFHLKALLANLHNVSSTEYSFLRDVEPDVGSLEKAIEDYRRYVSNHPRYLDSLLVTENGSTVHTVRV